MKEDYVSFETAKLLKEKGFDWSTLRSYDKDGKIKDILCPLFLSEDTAMPTLQMAMKWLREKHNIHITIDCDICDSFDFYSIIRIKSEESWKTYVEYEDEGSNTYEEAVEAVLEYCLTNLI